MSQHKLLLPKLEEFVKVYMSKYDPSHDWEHVNRVRNIALKIATSIDGDLDLQVVEISALLHDFNDTKYQESSEAFNVSEYLTSLGYPLEMSTLVHKIVQTVSYRKELAYKDLGEIDHWRENCLELHIVQDADKLEAMGAFGIMRCAAYSGVKNIVLYGSDIDYKSETFGDSPAEVDSCIGHFYGKYEYYLILFLINSF
ncbi:hypothetical protein K7432_007744 [Basidiobolus ranarum]|uniref:HD/PDEase domain-containing protein n=1 Tax=Basidiobolus ranarum TaxID=34480 RepID=A0ABR2VZN6_9FUNG